jgi:hypothetical protein
MGCDKVSVTFDPYMFISLPVPSKNVRMVTVVLFFANANPVKLGVRVTKMGNMKDLREATARLVGMSPDTLVLAEIYSFRPFKIPDAKPLFDLRGSDIIFAYVFFSLRIFSFAFLHNLLNLVFSNHSPAFYLPKLLYNNLLSC